MRYSLIPSYYVQNPVNRMSSQRHIKRFLLRAKISHVFKHVSQGGLCYVGSRKDCLSLWNSVWPAAVIPFATVY